MEPLRGGGQWKEVRSWDPLKGFGALQSFLSLCFLPAMRGTAFLQHGLHTMIYYVTKIPKPRTNGAWAEALTLTAKIKVSSLSLLL